jgi:hypothetical protein
LWGASGAPRVTTAEKWLGRKAAKLTAEMLVLRYLAAFGPATVMDMQAWCGVTKLAAAFETLRPKLVTFRDEKGRELFDLPEAPRPDADMEALPRFLPVYDNVTLGFANRDRIVRDRPQVPVPQSVVLRSFLLDGFVAGFWNIVEREGTTTLMIEPFGKPSKRVLAPLIAEGHRLLQFAAPQAGDREVRIGSARPARGSSGDVAD